MIDWSGIYKKIIASILVIGGTICVGLDILGIFLPILPTTPFLLLAAFCYGRGSVSFYNWLVYHTWIGAYIRNYREGRGISVRQKVLTIALLWLTIGFTMWFGVPIWWLKIVLGMMALAVTTHVIMIKTLHPDSYTQIDKSQLVYPIEEEKNNGFIT
jgi:uncharacterized membrane protein YbaN (DUF454 family)